MIISRATIGCVASLNKLIGGTSPLASIVHRSRLCSTWCSDELRRLKHPQPNRRRQGVGRLSCQSSMPLQRPRRVIAHQRSARKTIAAYRHKQTTPETEGPPPLFSAILRCSGYVCGVGRGRAELHKIDIYSLASVPYSLSTRHARSSWRVSLAASTSADTV